MPNKGGVAAPRSNAAPAEFLDHRETFAQGSNGRPLRVRSRTILVRSATSAPTQCCCSISRSPIPKPARAQLLVNVNGQGVTRYAERDLPRPEDVTVVKARGRRLWRPSRVTRLLLGPGMQSHPGRDPGAPKVVMVSPSQACSIRLSRPPTTGREAVDAPPLGAPSVLGRESRPETTFVTGPPRHARARTEARPRNAEGRPKVCRRRQGLQGLRRHQRCAGGGKSTTAIK